MARKNSKLGKYNWDKLRAEFISGEWSSVTQFLTVKKVPLYNRAKTKGWVDAKLKYRKEVFESSSRQLMDSDISNLQEIRNRQARLARFMQLKGANTLQEKEVQTADDARKMIVSGMEQERKIAGLEGATKQNFTQINIGPKTNLDKLIDKMDYEELLGLIAELKRERTRRTLQPATEQGRAEAEDGEIV